jgi:DNA-directed RNA polymerase beta subunit
MSTSILRDFFRREGWIAGLHKNYMQYINMVADLVGGRVCGPTHTPEECMAEQETYQYDIVVGGITMCKIPAMTTGGYFIMQGSEKVIVIQEVRLKTELFTSNAAGIATCEVFLEKAHVPTRISMVDNSVMELDTNMIHNNMRGIKSIGIFELLFHVFESNLGHVSYLARSYCAGDADACITYVMSSMRGTGGLSFAEDKETIRYKMFGGMTDAAVVATLVTMVVACVKIHLKLASPSDRDDYVMKCLKTPGETVYRIFKQCVTSCRTPGNLGTSVENHIHTFIKRGDVSIGKRTYTKMSIQLSKRSDIDVMSCVRKVMMPCDENSPNIQMRQIHASQRGFICPCETPEGKTVGITKSLACCCMISTRTDMGDWVSANCEDNIFSGCLWVMLDGAAVGWCKQVCIAELKTLYPTASFTVKSNVLNVRAASGRPVRPLLKVEGHPVDRNRPDITYLDPAECEVAKITSTGYGGDWRSFSHMEIHPCTMLGLASSLIPFPEHNQSARNVFSSSMIKQAMQMDTRRDKACYTLQKPVVYTTIGREVGYDESPNGLNLVVCIMSVSGFNQEDAIIVKKSAVERGMFMSVVKNTTSVLVDDPWKTVGTEGGISIVHGGTERSLTEVKPMLSSPNVVDVFESAADGGRSKVHVTVKEHRTLNLGDKLSSRHGQKGVVGILMSEEDMPFNAEGITPDIIINPHAVPSRMTVGQLIESALGKAAVIKGAFVDGTPFAKRNANELRGDTERMTLGTTGEAIESPIAMGIVYYMALKHQAADKMYVRSSGSKSIMSRQPISGRSKGGGLRFGEMEYDCLIAHGASKMVTEVSESSDMVDAPYCIDCHIVTDVFDSKCRLCGKQTVHKRVPFSYVVFKDMMLAANIQVQTKID